ncbi:P27 family predicted phage terminase small subunit [Stella humosa]|uniref:P27 family predicted phage terminase small subunit n=1 Tax=Stella humosa TaxID=94 RepID=A0A3N1KYM2_9PROT|nr:phage terminase small subunit P27 family [Stella humosa]ROP84257.1 P27 family predicted phage terminase small subunit [Stella humosa]BBK33770.1 hypothetical protein STHU_44040 [Stella humosa]
MAKPARDPAARLEKAPAAPAHLSDRAKVEWRKLAPVAVALGTLTLADLRAFELLAETLATEREARDTITREGMSTPTGDGGLKPHPAVRIMEAARNQACRLLDTFGMTPRGRGNVERAAATTDNWDGLLS